eukprot:5736670-Amphidinium_carterae.1
MQTRGSRVVGSELFVQQVFITKAGYGKERERLLVFRDPVVLEHGKGFQAMLAVTQEFLQGALAVGSTGGITIVSQVHDRGVGKGFRQGVS